MCKSECIFPYLQVLRYFDDFSKIFLDKVYLKINDNSSGGKMAFSWSYSLNDKGNWAHVAEKNSQGRAQITTIKAIMKIFYLYYHKNISKIFVLFWVAKSCWSYDNKISMRIQFILEVYLYRRIFIKRTLISMTPFLLTGFTCLKGICHY